MSAHDVNELAGQYWQLRARHQAYEQKLREASRSNTPPPEDLVKKEKVARSHIQRIEAYAHENGLWGGITKAQPSEPLRAAPPIRPAPATVADIRRQMDNTAAPPMPWDRRPSSNKESTLPWNAPKAAPSQRQRVEFAGEVKNATIELGDMPPNILAAGEIARVRSNMDRENYRATTHGPGWRRSLTYAINTGLAMGMHAAITEMATRMLGGDFPIEFFKPPRYDEDDVFIDLDGTPWETDDDT